MLNKANQIMNQRKELANQARNMMNEAQQALVVLGYESVELDEVIPATTVTKEEKPAIIINKGHIVEVQTVKEIVIDHTDEIIALENEITFKDGQILGLNNQIKQLEDKVNELQSALNAKKLTKVKSMQEELKEYKQELEKGDDKPMSNLDLLKKIKKAPEFTLEQALEKQQDKIAKEQEEKETRKAKLPKYNLNYTEITFDKSIESKTMFGINGTITIDEKEYAFKATNNHSMPIIYGCMDMDMIKLTKEIITNDVERFNFNNNETTINFDHISDKDNALVVWRLTDDNGNITYHGYDKTRILTWDKNKFENYVGRKMIKNVFEDEKETGRALWKKLTNSQLADKFRAICKQVWPEDFTNDDNDPEPTKAVTKITKEVPQTTKDNRTIKYTGEIKEFTKAIDTTKEDAVMAEECDDLDF